MVVGTLSIILHMRGTQSLKDKRSIVKRIVARTRNQFNVAGAEVDDNDRIGSARLAFVSVGNDQRFMNSCMDEILSFVDRLALAEVVDHKIELIHC